MVGIIIAGVVCGLLILTAIILFVLESIIKKTLYSRGDGDLRISYPGVDESLTAERIYFENNKRAKLYGFIYKSKTVEGKELIVLSHGIGAGHNYLRPLIKRLCAEGFVIVGYDNYASFASEGKAIVSMSQAINDLECALRYIQNRDEYKNMKINLLGHSWGGFAVLNALHFKGIDIERIVSYSGFDSETVYYSHFAKGLIVFTPFIALRNLIKGGKYGLYSASSGLKHRKSTKILYIQGRSDDIVTLDVAANRFKKINNPNLEIVLLDDRYHFPYMTKDAEKNAREIFARFGLFGNEGVSVNENISYGDVFVIDEDNLNLVLSFLKK